MTGRTSKIFGWTAGLALVAWGGAAELAAQDGGGPFKGLFRGRGGDSRLEEGLAEPAGGAPSGTVTVAPSVTASARTAERGGEGNRFARQDGSVVVPRNATAPRRERRAVEAAGSQPGPYNPKFGVPVFEPDPGPAGPTLAQGGVHTARGAELTRYVPVEVKEDRKALREAEAQAQAAVPTEKELEEAARRKQDLFDEIYSSKSLHPPLTFESTVDRGPSGSQGPTRAVGDRVLRQYVPTGPAARKQER
jgi:hypothetical protein